MIESSAGGALLWLALTDKPLNVVACANLSIVSIGLLCYATLYYIIMLLLVDSKESESIGLDCWEEIYLFAVVARDQIISSLYNNTIVCR